MLSRSAQEAVEPIGSSPPPERRPCREQHGPAKPAAPVPDPEGGGPDPGKTGEIVRGMW